MQDQADKLDHHRYGDDVSLSPCIFAQSVQDNLNGIPTKPFPNAG
jgi:hypothetical protein